MMTSSDFEHGQEHHKAGRLRDAQACYQRAVAVNPYHADAWHMLGIVTHQLGNSRGAIEMLTRAIELAPAVAAFHESLGEIYRRFGMFDQAIECFSRATQLAPNSASAWHKLDLTLKAAGRIQHDEESSQ